MRFLDFSNDTTTLKFMLAFMALLGGYLALQPSYPKQPLSISLSMEDGCFYAVNYKYSGQPSPQYDCMSAEDFSSVKAGNPSPGARGKLEKIDAIRKENAANYTRLTKEAEYNANHLWEFNKPRLEKLLGRSL